jgi:hypothetical protein
MQAHSQPCSAQNSPVLGGQNAIHQRHKQSVFWNRLQSGKPNEGTHGCVSETISGFTNTLALVKSWNKDVTPL